MSEKTFNLLHEPWILALTPEGEHKELSLLDVFRNAHTLKGLAGELTTQDVALLRFFLAILYAVFGRTAPDGSDVTIKNPADAFARWKALWDMGRFPSGIIEKYLLSYEERFWLFHPEYPFYQVAVEPDLKTVDGKMVLPTKVDASRLIGDIAESDNKANLFLGRTQKDSLEYGEAVRWLLYINSFDLAPGGRPPSNAVTFKGYGLSWLNQLGLIWACGSNLFETLMLNFVLVTKTSAAQGIWGKHAPVWEKQEKCDAAALSNIETIPPTDPSSLLSMQFRRVELIRDSQCQVVTGLNIWSGHKFDEKNFLLEQMTLWKKDKQGNIVPKTHDESRHIWRDFSALFSRALGAQRPGIVDWLAQLKLKNLIELPFSQFCTAGTVFRQNTKIINIFTDSININLGLLLALGDDWVNRIISEIDTTEQLVNQIGYLAQNLSKARGDGDGFGHRDRAKEQAYFQLDLPFRNWLESIDPDNDEMNDACDRWWTQSQSLIRRLGHELVSQSGPQAFIGRELKENDVKRLYSSPDLYNLFLYKTSSRDALKGGRKNA